jgi:crotonobetainyl-CoA:carnitine CoA-transferase CaiB-like acyl-CoA transferase
MEAIHDQQMTANGYLVDYDHPELGRIKISGFPVRFGRTKINNNLLATRLGEHTERVLKEIAGYGDEELAQFRKENII